jgi:20S proteasome alpha/beta subunit
MTIAAGFRYGDGILLCADREITEGASKYSKSKVFGEQIGPNVSLGFAFSGSIDYATMAIQGILAVVKSSSRKTHAQIWLAIKDTIHEIYSESIGRLPEYQQETFQFSLLIAVWAEGTLKLFVTENTAITEEPYYRHIGIGRDLANYLFKHLCLSEPGRAPLHVAEMVSLRIIEHAKESVSGCGRETDVLIIDSKGVLTRKDQDDYRVELKILNSFDRVTELLFPLIADVNATDEDIWETFRFVWSVHKDTLDKIRAERLAEAQGEDEG